MFQIVKQIWRPKSVTLTFLPPEYETQDEAQADLKALKPSKYISYEIRKIENGN